MEKPIVGITCGDLNGIGLETIIKTFSDARMLEFCVPVIFASNKVINYYKKSLPDYPFNFTAIKKMDGINPKQINIFNCWEEEVNIQPGELNEIGGKYAIRSLEVATQCLADGEIDTLVTAPIHKQNTQTANFKFIGHTPYLKEKLGAKDVVMLLYADGFRVALATEHLPIQKVASTLSIPLLVQKCQILNTGLIQDFGIEKPKIAVLALNPHAGDHGLIGDEETTIIYPAIEQLRNMGIYAFGPYSADGFFAQMAHQKFDAILAMYHDQGLIPFKYIAGMEGVNYTMGLSKIRTSPDHGVAFDKAGQGIADEGSLRNAVFESINLWRQRNAYKENTANPLVRREIPKER